jgi:hypothetical protein
LEEAKELQDGGELAGPGGAADVALRQMRQVLGDVDPCLSAGDAIVQFVSCKKEANGARSVR